MTNAHLLPTRLRHFLNTAESFLAKNGIRPCWKWFIFVLFIGSVLALLGGLFRSIVRPDESMPVSNTLNDLTILKHLIELHRRSSDSRLTSDNWSEKLMENASDKRMRQFLAMRYQDGEILDPWLNPYMLIAGDDDGIPDILYSYGENETDNKGMKDDIVVRIED